MNKRAYTINKDTEYNRLSRRYCYEPNSARRHALHDILTIVHDCTSLTDAAYLVRAEYKTCKARIEAEKKQSTISRHTIENDQERSVVYREFYRRFVED